MTGADYSELVTQLAGLLVARDLQVTVAESCTGGGIAEALTSVAGSSSWFDRGFVTYSNAAKQEMLGVSADTLQHHGAVSEPVAREMAAGALSHSHAHISVAVTGIAGPDGGTTAKPVGTVCFGWCRRDGRARTASIVFPGERQAVRQQTVLMAIRGLIETVESVK